MTTKDKVKVFVECGISQRRIAEMAGIDKTTIGKWLKGTRGHIGENTQTAIEAALMDIAERLYNTVYETTSNIQYDDIKLD